jgi:hypothetical protein
LEIPGKFLIFIIAWITKKINNIAAAKTGIPERFWSNSYCKKSTNLSLSQNSVSFEKASFIKKMLKSVIFLTDFIEQKTNFMYNAPERP